MKERNPRQRFEIGQRVKNFFADPAIVEVFAEIEQENYAAFLAAKTDEERRTAQAQAHVMSHFDARMIGLMEDVEGARAEILAEEKRTSAPVLPK